MLIGRNRNNFELDKIEQPQMPKINKPFMYANVSLPYNAIEKFCFMWGCHRKNKRSMRFFAPNQGKHKSRPDSGECKSNSVDDLNSCEFEVFQAFSSIFAVGSCRWLTKVDCQIAQGWFSVESLEAKYRMPKCRKEKKINWTKGRKSKLFFVKFILKILQF